MERLKVVSGRLGGAAFVACVSAAGVSAIKALVSAPLWWRMWMHCFDGMSQMRAVVSSDPDTRRRPSNEIERQLTLAWWPMKVASARNTHSGFWLLCSATWNILPELAPANALPSSGSTTTAASAASSTAVASTSPVSSAYARSVWSRETL
uniref:Putative secreted protein n=1 Tax=Ixodes ricinus TaxID=34613 RepID=A0A6B0UVK0_IXORI